MNKPLKKIYEMLGHWYWEGIMGHECNKCMRRNLPPYPKQMKRYFKRRRK